MAIPSGFIQELQGRASLARYAEKRLVWDTRRSKPDRGEYWACCPFHEEKTASFKIDDRRGLYYCFGCQAKGNLFGFVREMEKVGFEEAVRILAGQCGLEVPVASPEEQRRAEEGERLCRANSVAAQFYRERLREPEGARALAYLRDERGLSDQTIERFGLGYAPNASGALGKRLRIEGVEAADSIAAGLVREFENGESYDFFRNRIMFPLEVPGRGCVGFGARQLGEGRGPKYLNSAESIVFQKGRMLYHFGPAREASRRTGQLIVTEGYMDVIALVAGGFEHAVAPLGTALGETHLDMLWGVAPEVVVALDGDEAGLRASGRVVQLALPKIQPGKEVCFALLPKGCDPDDLLRERGAAGLRSVLEDSLPLAEMVWRQESRRGNLDTPERAAALDRRIDSIVERISDKTLRFHYRDYLRERRNSLRASGRTGRMGRGSRTGAARGLPPVSAEARSSALQRTGGYREYAFRGWECAILLVLLNRPGLILEFAEEIGATVFQESELDSLRSDIISATACGDIPEQIGGEFRTRLVRIVRKVPHSQLAPFTDPSANEALAKAGLLELLENHRSLETHMRELAAAAERVAAGDAGPEVDRNIREVTAAVASLRQRTTAGDDAAAGEAKAARVKLQEMLEGRIWERDEGRGRQQEVTGLNDG